MTLVPKYEYFLEASEICPHQLPNSPFCLTVRLSLPVAICSHMVCSFLHISNLYKMQFVGIFVSIYFIV
jgi:hypothetical protein